MLRLIDAAFRLDAKNAVGPLNLTLEAGEAIALGFDNSREATIAARLAAALIKATTGTVLIGDFDPRVQPVQAKRLLGYVPAHAMLPPFHKVEDYFRFRADLWEVERDHAVARGLKVLARCRNPNTPYAISLAGAFIRPCGLLVLDQPGLEYAEVARRERDDGCAILTTHADESARASIDRALSAQVENVLR